MKICEAPFARKRVAGQHVDAPTYMGDPPASCKSRGSEFAEAVFSQGGATQRFAAREFGEGPFE